MTSTIAIETNLLSKTFGNFTAVKGLTLQVQRGEVFGFLGPNGAGKSTSIKMLLSLISPTSGSARLLGAPLGDPGAREQVGFLPEHFRFHDWLTAEEFLYMHGQLYGMSGLELKIRIRELLDLVQLAPFSKKYLRTYSKGMLQRIGIAQALLNHPALVFLDEPTSGLDPVGRRLVRDIIHELRHQGTSVFINSHLLGEIEVTCDRVAFVKHGEVVREIELKNYTDVKESVTIRIDHIDDETLNGLHSWGEDVRVDGANISMVISDETSLPQINRYLVEHRVDVFAVIPQRLSLEDLFIETLGKDVGI
jgi:ABC-2 type transport system ATP-binding protein